MKKLKAFWYILRRSLLDPLYYKELLSVSYGFSYKYIWMLLTCLVVVGLIPITGSYISYRSQIPSKLQEIKTTVLLLYPNELELRISNGKLYTNVDEPYAIPFPKSWGDMGKESLLVLDTSATVEDYPDTNAFMLATRNALVYPDRGSNAESYSTRVFYFREIPRSIYMDKDRFESILYQLDPYIQKAPLIIDWVVAIFVIIAPWFGGLMWSVGVLLGLIFNTFFLYLTARILRLSYSYGQLYRLAMHGVTWSLLTQLLLTFTKQEIPYASSVVFFLWMGVVFFSLKEKDIDLRVAR